MGSRVLLVWLHVLAAAVWYGGLMTAMVSVRAARSAESAPAAAAIARRFQRVAWAALFVLLATGLGNVVQVVPVLQAGASMPSFMWTLTAKVALVGVIVAVTAVQQSAHVRALAAAGDGKGIDGYLRLGRVNLLVGAVVLLLGVSLSLAGGIG